MKLPLLATLLLCTPIASALAIPLYDFVTPTPCGWPFHCLWQTGCLVAGALATCVAYLLDERFLRAYEDELAR